MEKKNRTQEEITKMISDLENQKNVLPQTSFFGDDNHNAIDCQIKVLKENLTEEQIYDMSWVNYSENAAIAVREWLDGEIEADMLF